MCHPAPMQSGLVSEIDMSMERYLRLCLRAKSVRRISALARDAAWAFSGVAGIKKTSRRSQAGTIWPTRILITEIPAET
jgi:hypothetical protein